MPKEERGDVEKDAIVQAGSAATVRSEGPYPSRQVRPNTGVGLDELTRRLGSESVLACRGVNLGLRKMLEVEGEFGVSRGQAALGKESSKTMSSIAERKQLELTAYLRATIGHLRARRGERWTR